MANVLKMDKQTLIKQLLDLGWSYRRIHRETGIHRDTIARYDPSHPGKTPRSRNKRFKIGQSMP